MKRPSKVWVLVLAVAVPVAGLVLARALRRAAPESGERPAIPVQVRAPLVDTAWVILPYRGVVEGDRDVPLSFRSPGQVARIGVREGDRVEAGVIVAELDPAELEGRLGQVRAELARLRAQEVHWAAELEVDERLFAVGAVARARLDATRLSHRNAALAVEAAEASMAEVEARVDGTRIRAPHAGRVARVTVVEGEGVQPGQPVLWLAGGAPRLRIDLVEQDRARGVYPGTAARFRLSECPDGAARVDRVDAAARPPFGAVRAYLVPGDPSCLAGVPVGISVPVEVLLPGHPEARFVPLSAVDFRAGVPRVFRVGRGEVVDAVPVALGVQQGGLQEVMGDLYPGDRIVVTGTTNLSVGDRVRAVDGAGGLP